MCIIHVSMFPWKFRRRPTPKPITLSHINSSDAEPNVCLLSRRSKFRKFFIGNNRQRKYYIIVPLRNQGLVSTSLCGTRRYSINQCNLGKIVKSCRHRYYVQKSRDLINFVSLKIQVSLRMPSTPK